MNLIKYILKFQIQLYKIKFNLNFQSKRIQLSVKLTLHSCRGFADVRGWRAVYLYVTHGRGTHHMSALKLIRLVRWGTTRKSLMKLSYPELCLLSRSQQRLTPLPRYFDQLWNFLILNFMFTAQLPREADSPAPLPTLFQKYLGSFKFIFNSS